MRVPILGRKRPERGLGDGDAFGVAGPGPFCFSISGTYRAFNNTDANSFAYDNSNAFCQSHADAIGKSGSITETCLGLGNTDSVAASKCDSCAVSYSDANTKHKPNSFTCGNTSSEHYADSSTFSKPDTIKHSNPYSRTDSVFNSDSFSNSRPRPIPNTSPVCHSSANPNPNPFSNSNSIMAGSLYIIIVLSYKLSIY